MLLHNGKFEVSVNRLAQELDFDRRTLSARLVGLTPRLEGTAHLYDLREIIARLTPWRPGLDSPTAILTSMVNLLRDESSKEFQVALLCSCHSPEEIEALFDTDALNKLLSTPSC